MMLELLTTVDLVSFNGMLPVLIFRRICHLLLLHYHHHYHHHHRHKQRLGPTRHIPLDTEDAHGLPIFVLVLPDHDVRSDDTGKPIVGDDLLQFLSQFPLELDDVFNHVDQRYSTLFVRVPPDIISLQLCTPKVVGA
jgi:hypothetical protein